MMRDLIDIGFSFCCAFVLLSQVAIGAETNTTELAKKVREILRDNCYRCHGQDGAVEGGINYILDFRTLVSRKMITAGDPAKSRLFKRVNSGQMPPEDEQPRPNASDIDTLKQWIESGASDTSGPAAPRTFVTTEAILQSIRQDLLTTGDRDRRFARYFTLTHLYNAGLSEDELQTYRHGLSKLINSLSWGRRIVVPLPVDPTNTVFRIDLRDLRWTERVWENILAAYPYGISPDTINGAYCVTATGCRLPWVRADWFVAEASRPPLYHQVLQLPTTDRELEIHLHVDVPEDIRTERAVRAGFNGSGVSRNNRVIERHDSPYGAYWKSYDFAANSGSKNIFANPLGPGDGPLDFRPDGGEIIFNLPNGLQAYMLVDAQGRRIDKGPINVVSDPKRPDRAVENGISCMSCHVGGMIEKADQIRAHVQSNPNAFPSRDAGTILALYPDKTRFDALIREDAERFRNSVKETGGRIGSSEPIVALTLRFEGELDLPLAAAEAGLTTQEFKKRLGGSASLARTLGSLNVEGGTVQRQVFLEAFGELVRTFGLGTPLKAGNRAIAGASEAGLPSYTMSGSPTAPASILPANRFPSTTSTSPVGAAGSSSPRVLGTPGASWVPVFNGSNLDGWRSVDGSGIAAWTAKQGELVLDPARGTSSLCTEEIYGNFDLSCDFWLDKRSNSGIYLRGRYELQLLDDASYPQSPPKMRCGSIFEQIPPATKAYKGPGQWNTLHVKLEGKNVNVTMNGISIILNKMISNVSPLALDNFENQPGPILLQNHKTSVRFRKLLIRRIP